MQRKLTFMLIFLVAGIFSLYADNVQVTRRLNITKQLRVTDNSSFHSNGYERLIVNHASGQNAISYLYFLPDYSCISQLTSANLVFEVKQNSNATFRVVPMEKWPAFKSYEFTSKEEGNLGCILVKTDYINLSDTIQKINEKSTYIEFVPKSEALTNKMLSIDVSTFFNSNKVSPLILAINKANNITGALHFIGALLPNSQNANEAYIELTYSVPSEDLTTTMHMEGYKSYYDPHFARKVDAHTVAYVAKTTNQTNTVRLVPIADGIIPAGTPVILKTNQHDANNYHLSLIANSDIDPIDDNLLKVSDENTSINAYRLGWKEDIGVGFFLFDFRTTTQSGVVYLDPSDVNTTNASEIHFIIDDSNSIEALPIDGSIDAQVYNLTGASCTSMQSGKIYIQNRKIVIKP